MMREYFEEAYKRYFWTTATQLSRKFRLTEDDARELAQEAWTRGLQCLDQLDDDAKFLSWITSIAFRVACDHFRHKNRLNQLQAVHDGASVSRIDVDAIDVHMVLDQCRPRQREMLQLLGEGHSYAEVATVLGTSTKALYSEAYRLRCALQNRMRANTIAD